MKTNISELPERAYTNDELLTQMISFSPHGEPGLLSQQGMCSGTTSCYRPLLMGVDGIFWSPHLEADELALGSTLVSFG